LKDVGVVAGSLRGIHNVMVFSRSRIHMDLGVPIGNYPEDSYLASVEAT
jgi:hypothetical protein